MQHSATYCNILHHAATHCTALQHTLQHNATHCITSWPSHDAWIALQRYHQMAMQHTATHRTTLQRTARNNKTSQQHSPRMPRETRCGAIADCRCNTLQHTAPHCNALQRSATLSSTQQDIATTRHSNTSYQDTATHRTQQDTATHLTGLPRRMKRVAAPPPIGDARWCCCRDRWCCCSDCWCCCIDGCSASSPRLL